MQLYHIYIYVYGEVYGLMSCSHAFTFKHTHMYEENNLDTCSIYLPIKQSVSTYLSIYLSI